jgi:hypothetical protein
MKITSALAVAFAGVTGLGCASTHVRTDQDPRVDLLDDYHSFDVKRGQVLVNGVADRRNTLVRDRVESALERELQEKGLAPNAQNPDLIATYTAGSRDIMELDNAWDGVYRGYGYGYGYGAAWVDEYTESTLLIDLIDRRTNKLVWRAIVDIDDDLRSAKTVNKAVDKALAKYPGT